MRKHQPYGSITQAADAIKVRPHLGGTLDVVASPRHDLEPDLRPAHMCDAWTVAWKRVAPRRQRAAHAAMRADHTRRHPCIKMHERAASTRTCPKEWRQCRILLCMSTGWRFLRPDSSEGLQPLRSRDCVCAWPYAWRGSVACSRRQMPRLSGVGRLMCCAGACGAGLAVAHLAACQLASGQQLAKTSYDVYVRPRASGRLPARRRRQPRRALTQCQTGQPSKH